MNELYSQLIVLLLSLSGTLQEASLVQTTTPPLEAPVASIVTATTSVPTIPFFSQFNDISSPVWQRRGCGIASLAMVIEYFKPGIVTADSLLNEALTADGYIDNIGWKHHVLAETAVAHGFQGKSFDLSQSDSVYAFTALQDALMSGPVIASVHYTFDPKNIIPHLVVINGVDGDFVYYNDPADTSGNRKITKETFTNSWKKRYIQITPML